MTIRHLDFPYFGDTNVDGTTENVQERGKEGDKATQSFFLLFFFQHRIAISNKYGSLREREGKEATYCSLGRKVALVF